MLIQFIKQVGWDEIWINAKNEEYYLMCYGINLQQKVLAENGFAPR